MNRRYTYAVGVSCIIGFLVGIGIGVLIDNVWDLAVTFGAVGLIMFVYLIANVNLNDQPKG